MIEGQNDNSESFPTMGYFPGAMIIEKALYFSEMKVRQRSAELAWAVVH